WADIFVPRDTRPGRYLAIVTVETAQGHVAAQVGLNVWDFELPLQPSLDSAFLIGQNTAQAQIELLKHRLMPLPFRPAIPLEDRLIADWGLKSANVGIWSTATAKRCIMPEAPSLETVRQALAAHDPALRFYNYTADEIDLCEALIEPMKAWARVLHKAGVSNLVTMTPVPELYDDG